MQLTSWARTCLVTEVIEVDFEHQDDLQAELARAIRQCNFLRRIGRQGFFTPAMVRLMERLERLIRDYEQRLGIRPSDSMTEEQI